MKTKVFPILLAVCLVLAMGVSVSAQDDETCSGMLFLEGWVRPSPMTAGNGAAYGLLTNLGGEMDTLVSVSTDAAEVVELHEMAFDENDVMMMREVEGGFMIPPHDFVELKPGGLHIMLINLVEELVEGETIDLTLNFEHAGEVLVTIPIHDMTMMDMDGGMGMHDESHDMDMVEAHHPMIMVPSCDGVQVIGVWARPTFMDTANSAAYALLVNPTDTDDMLVSATTDAAEVVELHEMVIGEDDVMMMSPIEGGIHVPAGRAVRLQPGGLHIMLINTTEMLEEGDTIDITLTFAEMGDVALSVPIRTPDVGGMNMGGHGGMDMGEGEGDMGSDDESEGDG